MGRPLCVSGERLKVPKPAHEAEWMKLAAPERKAWIGLLRVHREVTRHLDAALADEHGLSLAEWDVLVRLAPAGDDGVRMGDLAGLVLLSPSGLTRLVDRLRTRGLVERRPGKEDAREAYVALAKRGLDLLAKAAPLHNDELRAHFLDGLMRDEVARLADILDKIASTPARCARHPHPADG